MMKINVNVFNMTLSFHICTEMAKYNRKIQHII